jgi:hypothetical protein
VMKFIQTIVIYNRQLVGWSVCHPVATSIGTPSVLRRDTSSLDALEKDQKVLLLPLSGFSRKVFHEYI